MKRDDDAPLIDWAIIGTLCAVAVILGLLAAGKNLADHRHPSCVTIGSVIELGCSEGR